MIAIGTKVRVVNTAPYFGEEVGVLEFYTPDKETAVLVSPSKSYGTAKCLLAVAANDIVPIEELP